MESENHITEVSNEATTGAEIPTTTFYKTDTTSTIGKHEKNSHATDDDESIERRLYYLSGTRTTAEYSDSCLGLSDLKLTHLETFDGVGIVENTRLRTHGHRGKPINYLQYLLCLLRAGIEGVFGYHKDTHRPILTSLNTAFNTSKTKRIVIGAHSRGAAIGSLTILAGMYNKAKEHLGSPNANKPLWNNVQGVSFVLLDPVSGTDNNVKGLAEQHDIGIYEMVREIQKATKNEDFLRISIVSSRYYPLHTFEMSNEWLSYVRDPRVANGGNVETFVAGFGHTDMVAGSHETATEIGQQKINTYYEEGSTPTDLSRAIIQRELLGKKKDSEVHRINRNIQISESRCVANIETLPYLDEHTSARRHKFDKKTSIDWLCDYTMSLMAQISSTSMRRYLSNLKNFILTYFLATRRQRRIKKTNDVNDNISRKESLSKSSDTSVTAPSITDTDSSIDLDFLETTPIMPQLSEENAKEKTTTHLKNQENIDELKYEDTDRDLSEIEIVSEYNEETDVETLSEYSEETDIETLSEYSEETEGVDIQLPLPSSESENTRFELPGRLNLNHPPYFEFELTSDTESGRTTNETFSSYTESDRTTNEALSSDDESSQEDSDIESELSTYTDLTSDIDSDEDLYNGIYSDYSEETDDESISEELSDEESLISESDALAIRKEEHATENVTDKQLEAYYHSLASPRSLEEETKKEIKSAIDSADGFSTNRRVPYTPKIQTKLHNKFGRNRNIMF